MVTLLRNQKFRQVLLQGTVISVAAVLLVMMVINARASLQAQGMTSGFGFLNRSTGWDFSFSVLDYSIRDTYRRTMLIGILNTLLLGGLGILFATLFGIIVGLVRTSRNSLFAFLGTLYVELFRNVPLILQAVFWYAIVSHLPRPKSAYSLADMVFLSGRGIYIPSLNIHLGAVALMVLATVLTLMIWLWLKRRIVSPARRRVFKWALLTILLAVIALLGLSGRVPDTSLLNIPALKGLNYRGGVRISPELSALLIAIALYGGAYIGEVFRAGLMAVPRGQMEAGHVLGLKSSHIFTRIRLPLAIRLVLPSLTNQYVQLMKATTIGLVVGFSDFFMIVSTSINQSGQTLELLAILMGGFLLINLSIAFVMNTINSRIALKGYEVKS